MITALLLLMYVLGVVIQILLEAQNSIKSPTNSVRGIVEYLELQGVRLLARLFFSLVLYTAIMAMTEKAIAAAGFTLPIWGLAGLAGYASSGFVRQISGLIPSFRVE